jgi:membrane fusion protein (multidrug efflux system)
MFVDVTVVLPHKESVVSIPTTGLVHASFGDSVFVVESEKASDGAPVTRPDGKPSKVARQQFVRVGATRGDFVSIEDGVKAGEEIVTAGAFKLRNGARVAINNDIRPNAQLDPHPENR